MSKTRETLATLKAEALNQTKGEEHKVIHALFAVAEDFMLALEMGSSALSRIADAAERNGGVTEERVRQIIREQAQNPRTR